MPADTEPDSETSSPQPETQLASLPKIEETEGRIPAETEFDTEINNPQSTTQSVSLRKVEKAEGRTPAVAVPELETNATYKPIAEAGDSDAVESETAPGRVVPVPSIAPVVRTYASLPPLANIRSSPGIQAPVISRIVQGTRLNVVGEEQGWLRLKLRNGSRV